MTLELKAWSNADTTDRSSPSNSIASTTMASAWPTLAADGRRRGGAAAGSGSFFDWAKPTPTEGRQKQTLFLAAKFWKGGKDVKGGNSMPKWQIRDLVLLRRHYATTAGCEMARMLGRSLGAVQQMARRLGLRRIDGHASTPAMRESGRLRRGRPFSDEHRAALRAARQRRLNNEVQST